MKETDEDNFPGIILNKTRYSKSALSRMLNMDRNRLREELKAYELYEKDKWVPFPKVCEFLDKIGVPYKLGFSHNSPSDLESRYGID